MKLNLRKAWTCSVALAGAIVIGQAEQAATVKGDRVNVRGQASPTSEVITQLKKGESVTVLEEIAAKNPKKGEPRQWARIQLPANTPVWVFAPYVDETTKVVNVNRINVRAGPGEHYSVLGRLPRGTSVKDIRVVESWMEIEAPSGAYAFVASDLLEISAPSVTAEPKPVDLPPATNAPPVIQTVVNDPPPVSAIDTNAVPVQPPPDLPVVAPPADPVAKAGPPARRIVVREGLVVISRSVQAPTTYALEHRETRRIFNYLHSENEEIKLKNYAGRKVILSGEELIDRRWLNTPIVDVESIRFLP